MKQYKDLISLLSIKETKTQLAIAAVCMLIGILIVTQLRAQQTSSQSLQSATESDLSHIVSNLNNEINMLRAEAANLRLQLFKIERASNDSSAIMKESVNNLNNLRIIAGLTKVRGPGIKIRVIDDNKSLNSYDLVDIITELRVGGAEAIAVNGVRIVSQTGITKQEQDVYIDQKLISPPYEILAIGNTDVLHESLTLAGGVRDKLSSLKGVSFYITKENNIRIDSVVKSSN